MNELFTRKVSDQEKIRASKQAIPQGNFWKVDYLKEVEQSCKIIREQNSLLQSKEIPKPEKTEPASPQAPKISTKSAAEILQERDELTKIEKSIKMLDKSKEVMDNYIRDLEASLLYLERIRIQ